MNKKLLALSSAVLLALPTVIFAQLSAGPTPVAQSLDIVQIIDLILNFVWPIFIGFAVIMFLVAGFQFLVAQGDPAKVGGARLAILWGVIGVVVGLIAFSIPLIVRNTFGL